jgi:hypothetical protein
MSEPGLDGTCNRSEVHVHAERTKVRGRLAGCPAHSRHRSLIRLAAAGTRKRNSSNETALLVNRDQDATTAGVLKRPSEPPKLRWRRDVPAEQDHP